MAYVCDHSPHYHAVHGMCEPMRRASSTVAGEDLSVEEAEAFIVESAVGFGLKLLQELGVSEGRIERATAMMQSLIEGSAPIGPNTRRLSRRERTALRDAVWMMVGDALGRRTRRQVKNARP